MPRHYITRYGVEQSRRKGSALFPPELSFEGFRFTLERDGMHAALETEQGTVNVRLSRAQIASLMAWLHGEQEWIDHDLDAAYYHEGIHQDCGYCVRNLSHTWEVHQEALERAKERRQQLAEALNERLFESA
jgi:hypothetical protein